MSLARVLVTGSVLSLLTIGAPAAAQAPKSHLVNFTFNNPVRLPNVTLPPGKYEFRLADLISNRRVVQITSADGSRPYGFFLTIPTHREETPEDPQIRFIETASDQPPAVGSYWYPGEKDGWEFVYSRDEALKMAATARQPVLTTAENVSGDAMQKADLVRVGPGGEQPVDNSAAPTAVAAQSPRTDAAVSAANDTPAAPAPRAAAARSTAAASQNQAADQAPTFQTSRRELPATASNMPTVVLAGLAALLAAFGLSLQRRRLL
jgi:LPXTG-motif cell wall-anchored protein